MQSGMNFLHTTDNDVLGQSIFVEFTYYDYDEISKTNMLTQSAFFNVF